MPRNTFLTTLKVKITGNFFGNSTKRGPAKAYFMKPDFINNIDDLRELMGDEVYRNFQRNQTLIDFDYIPEPIQKNIINTFNEITPAARMKVLTYLINKRCNQLIECVEEFYNG